MSKKKTATELLTETIIFKTTTAAVDSIAAELANTRRNRHELNDAERDVLTAGIQNAIQAALELANIFQLTGETDESDELTEQ